IKMDADPQCLLQHKDAVLSQEVVVNANGTLKHVFVYVKAGLEGKSAASPTQPAKLDQHGCLYEPHVSGMRVNQPLEIVNSDPTLHNVNCKPAKSKPFNIAQPVKGMKSTKTFTAPEVMVKCACNVHPWMATYIGVLEHPFFGVTGDDGRFTIAGLPAGQYTLEAWHEKYGTQTQTVSVGDGEAKSVDFEFPAK
ncbi:MAG: carboxypeptidase regulatory-like domain-containing protein, partial [Candidatus Omnitrophica bacterium]|nr:carboxypeptidase regulatory-like domain-containing protein [Candidatus Omnitrophota bacterium]